MEKDTFKTIVTSVNDILFKDKGSKFYGFAFPIQNENDVKHHLIKLKKAHHSARHWCYAYQIGTEQDVAFRVNDDGEPNNSAGLPIFGQIQSFNVTNLLIVVVRYFGGVKLGIGGLINAYKTTAKTTLEASEIIEKTINILFVITFDYKKMNKVMRIIKENSIKILDQKLELDCRLKISIRKNNAETIFKTFNDLFEIKIEKVN